MTYTPQSFLSKKVLLPIICNLLSLSPILAQRSMVSINDGWLFEKATMVNLPHTWNTDAYQTAQYDQGTKTYSRTLSIKAPGPRRYYLRIDAASKSSEIRVNGQLAGTHQGGYTAHLVDITPYVHHGDDNIVEIKVNGGDQDVPPISADFTFMGGLYRNVWLISTPQLHFNLPTDAAPNVRLTPSITKQGQGQIGVRINVNNDGSTKTGVQVVTTLYDPQGKRIAQQARKMDFKSGTAHALKAQQFTVANPQLWSPAHPNLYRVEVELRDKHGKVIDSESHNTALRTVAFDPDKGFILNGEPLKLNGICLHQDQQPYGVALTPEQHLRDIEMAKEMGANFIRLAHYPQADDVLDACDRLGLLVWEEIPVVNYVPRSEAFAETAKANLREMIRQHYNHPSVMLWGYMNEILLRMRAIYKGQDEKEGIDRILKQAHELEAIVHEEDPSRISAMALHGSDEYNKLGIADIPQVVGWNLYQGWYGGQFKDFDEYLDRQHREHPAHSVIVSEWGAGSDLRLHSRQPKAFDFTMEYQQQYIEHYLRTIDERPFVAGGAYWNFVDFSSAAREESMPGINNKGILTADRRVKDVFYLFQAWWRKDLRVTHIALGDRDGRWADTQAKQQVKVYSNEPQLSLVVNGRSMGSKTVDGCTAVFDVELQEGKNIIKALDAKGQEVDAATLHFALDGRMPMQNGQLLAINVGSAASYTSPSSHVTWHAQQPYTDGSWGYTQGKTESTQGLIRLTDDTPLYQTMMKDQPVFQLDAGAGSYEVVVLWVDKPKASAVSEYLLGKGTGNQYEAHTTRLTLTSDTPQLTIDTRQLGIDGMTAGLLVRKISGK